MPEEEYVKYLEFLQKIISRMNSNSFMIKRWTITIVSGFIALAAKSGNIYYLLSAVIPAFMFWLLDSYYLHMERKYRKLYENVIIKYSNNDDSLHMFELNIPNDIENEEHYIDALKSKTEGWLYGTTIGLLLVIVGIVVIPKIMCLFAIFIIFMIMYLFLVKH